MQHRATYTLAAILFAVALTIRIGFVVDLSTAYPHFNAPPKGFDQHTYYQTAQQILAGTFSQPHYMAPGYARYFLAPLLWLTGNIYSIKICQAILSALCIPIIFIIGQKLYSSRAGIIAAVLLCFSYLHIGFTGFLLTETLAMTLLCLLLMVVIHLRQDVIVICLIGFLAGSIITVRPNLGLAAFFLLIPLLQKGATNKKKWAILLLGIAIPIIPITWHNSNPNAVTPVSSNFLPNLRIGLNPDANGVFEYAPAYREGWYTIAEDTVQEIHTAQDILGQVVHHPLKYLELTLTKTLRLIEARLHPDTIRFDTDIATTFLGMGHDTIQFWHLVLLALPALLFTRGSQTNKYHHLIPLCVIAILAPLVGLFFISSRLSVPAIPFLALLSGCGIDRLITHIRATQWQPVLNFIAVLIIGVGLVYTGVTSYQNHVRPHIFALLNPAGVHRIYHNRLVIKDVWWPETIPQTRQTLLPDQALRKALNINTAFFTLLQGQDIYIVVPVMALELPPNGATLTIDVNENPLAELLWHPQDVEIQKWKTLRLPVDIRTLHQGLNTIDLALSQGQIVIGWDPCVDYNRSFKKEQGEWTNLAATGELQIIIESLKK